MARNGQKVRLGNWFDVAVFLLLSILVIVAFLSKLVQYYGFQIHDLDTGIYSNLVWNLVNGNWFYSGVLNCNYLGEHFSPIIVVFAPFFIVHPSPVWLLGAQGLAVGTTYVLLYFIAVKIFCEANTNFAQAVGSRFCDLGFLLPSIDECAAIRISPLNSRNTVVGGGFFGHAA